MPDKVVMKLSDQMAVVVEEPELELTVTAYNINAGHNTALMENCRPLGEYVDFIDRVRLELRGKKTDAAKIAALEKVIDECIRDGIMKDFLINHREAVIKMNLVEYNEQDEREGILEDGIEIGKEQGRLDMLASLVDDGLITTQDAAKRLGMSIEEYTSHVERSQ